ncbi:MAG: hypothetical protein OXC54_03960 [Rhodospirillaceae bacterium]|nr:hypothetical protein [Rhodospirillaceae bacterium]
MSLTFAHLVGSLPYPDAATTFHEITTRLGRHVKRIPDGETGERARWIYWQRAKVENNPAMEVATDDGPTQIHQWDGKLVREWELFRFKDGVDAATVDFDPGYAPDAIKSYDLFRQLRDAGEIPNGVRFQVCLPTPMAIGYWFVAPSARADFFLAYERAFRADLATICEAIPNEDLAIQWDVCQEVLAWEGYFPDRPDSYKEDITGMLARLGNAVPEPVELGYHLCYGTPNDEHLVMPKDLANAVEMTHGILASLDRSLQFMHMPAPKDRDDDAYYGPLRDLNMPADCELFLGIIHHDDHLGDQRRIAAARKAITDFGVATECGWGRGDPERAPGLLDSHRIALESA